jgi:hypothetical protein
VKGFVLGVLAVTHYQRQAEPAGPVTAGLVENQVLVLEGFDNGDNVPLTLVHGDGLVQQVEDSRTVAGGVPRVPVPEPRVGGDSGFQSFEEIGKVRLVQRHVTGRVPV